MTSETKGEKIRKVTETSLSLTFPYCVRTMDIQKITIVSKKNLNFFNSKKEYIRKFFGEKRNSKSAVNLKSSIKGRFPIEIKTEIRYLNIRGSRNFMR